MTDEQRDKARSVQDALLANPIAHAFANQFGRHKPIFEGGPSLDELQRMVYPEHTERILRIIREANRA